MDKETQTMVHITTTDFDNLVKKIGELNAQIHFLRNEIINLKEEQTKNTNFLWSQNIQQKDVERWRWGR
jgi:hypothetical protein